MFQGFLKHQATHQYYSNNYPNKPFGLFIWSSQKTPLTEPWFPLTSTALGRRLRFIASQPAASEVPKEEPVPQQSTVGDGKTRCAALPEDVISSPNVNATGNSDGAYHKGILGVFYDFL